MLDSVFKGVNYPIFIWYQKHLRLLEINYFIQIHILIMIEVNENDSKY